MKLKNGSIIEMEAGEKLRGGDMITLAHKYPDWKSPAPPEEDEMVCVRVKMDEDVPIGTFVLESTPSKKGYFYAQAGDEGSGEKGVD